MPYALYGSDQDYVPLGRLTPASRRIRSIRGFLRAYGLSRKDYAYLEVQSRPLGVDFTDCDEQLEVVDSWSRD